MLQTKAPGISLINYTTDINDLEQQLVMQQKLLDLLGEIAKEILYYDNASEVEVEEINQMKKERTK